MNITIVTLVSPFVYLHVDILHDIIWIGIQIYSYIPSSCAMRKYTSRGTILQYLNNAVVVRMEPLAQVSTHVFSCP